MGEEREGKGRRRGRGDGEERERGGRGREWGGRGGKGRRGGVVQEGRGVSGDGSKDTSTDRDQQQITALSYCTLTGVHGMRGTNSRFIRKHNPQLFHSTYTLKPFPHL